MLHCNFKYQLFEYTISSQCIYKWMCYLKFHQYLYCMFWRDIKGIVLLQTSYIKIIIANRQITTSDFRVPNIKTKKTTAGTTCKYNNSYILHSRPEEITDCTEGSAKCLISTEQINKTCLMEYLMIQSILFHEFVTIIS